MPGPDVRAEHRAQLAAPDLAPVQVGGEPRRPAGRRARPPGRGWPGGRRRRRRPGRPPPRRSGPPAGSGPGRRCAPARGSRPGPSSIRSSGLTAARRRAARRRRRSGRPAGGTPGCRRRTAPSPQRRAPRAAAAASRDRAAGVEDVGRAQRGVPGGDADLPGVDDGDRHGRVPRGEQGRLVGAAHLAPTGGSRGSRVGAVRRPPSRRPRAGRRRRPRGADRPELPERLGHHLGGRAVGALVVHGRADHDLQRHHDDAALLRHLGRQRGRRVGDDHGRPGHARKA